MLDKYLTVLCAVYYIKLYVSFKNNVYVLFIILNYMSFLKIMST